jgi:hypothetical protein
MTNPINSLTVPSVSTPNESSRNAATRPCAVGRVTVRSATDSSGKVNRAPSARVVNDNARWLRSAF